MYYIEGKNLRTFRKFGGFKRRKLAKYLEVPFYKYLLMECGLKELKMKQISLLANLFLVDEYDVITSDLRFDIKRRMEDDSYRIGKSNCFGDMSFYELEKKSKHHELIAKCFQIDVMFTPSRLLDNKEDYLDKPIEELAKRLKEEAKFLCMNGDISEGHKLEIENLIHESLTI